MNALQMAQCAPIVRKVTIFSRASVSLSVQTPRMQIPHQASANQVSPFFYIFLFHCTHIFCSLSTRLRRMHIRWLSMRKLFGELLPLPGYLPLPMSKLHVCKYHIRRVQIRYLPFSISFLFHCTHIFCSLSTRLRRMHIRWLSMRKLFGELLPLPGYLPLPVPQFYLLQCLTF
jgi:hypothetical protein